MAAAKVLLLSPAKKAAYDEQLRERVQPQAVAAEDACTPRADDSSPWADITGALPSAVRRERACGSVSFPASARRPAGKRRTNLGPMIAAGLAGAAVLLGLAAWIALGSGRRGGQTAGQAALTGKQSGQPTVREPIDRPRPDVRQAGEAGAARSKAAAPRAAIVPSPAKEPSRVETGNETPAARPFFEKPSEAVEKPGGSPQKPAMPSFDFSGDKPADNSAGPPAAKKRLPVPDDAVQRKIAAQLARDYAPSRAQTPAERTKLACQLVQAAKASKEPNERYVLLGQARELSGQAGDVDMTIQVIEITGAFDIDVLNEKYKALSALGEKANAEQSGPIFNAAQAVIAQALSAGPRGLLSLIILFRRHHRESSGQSLLPRDPWT